MLDPGSELPLAEPAARAVRLRPGPLALAALLAACTAWLALGRATLAGEALVTPEDLSRTLVIDQLSVQGDRVAGVVLNLADRPIRDVRLQIVFSWLWADEHRQGTDDPSFVTTELLADEIPPHGQTTFGYTYPAANTARMDGRFIVDARIIGFRSVSETRTIQ